MADITFTADVVAPQANGVRPAWLDRAEYRMRVHARRARRDRYVANLIATLGTERAADLGIDTARRRYPWFEAMFRAMSGR